jgi:hypothetical protein
MDGYTASDIEWVKDLLSKLTDTGTWMIPASATIFVFNKEDKTYRTISMLGTDNFTVNRITHVILQKELGYTRQEVDDVGC